MHSKFIFSLSLFVIASAYFKTLELGANSITNVAVPMGSDGTPTNLSSSSTPQTLIDQPYGDANCSSPEATTSQRSSKQTAPYAMEDGSGGDGINNKSNTSLVFRLSVDRQSGVNANKLGEESWTFVSPNGTLQRATLDMRRLLETLRENNLTSEVRFDDNSPGTVNITISNIRALLGGGGGGGHGHQGADVLLLEELIDESKLPQANQANGALGSIVSNNHRSVTSVPTRSKPSGVELPAVMTAVPPLRRTADVVAENYTARRVADEANQFALRLIHQLNVETLGSHNIVQSPFAVYQGLALLLAGAAGDTSKELDKLLLGGQSVYENTKLTHDQDRARLLASFNEALGQLQRAATNHLPAQAQQQRQLSCNLSACLDQLQYGGGTEGQHLIVANNFLFSPGAFEISNEFKSTVANHFGATSTLTKVEIGSTESIQVINNWIRRATAGIIPQVLNKRATFDEFNVLTLLSTSWLAQEWRNSFTRVTSPLRSSVRLKGQRSVSAVLTISQQQQQQKQAVVPDGPNNGGRGQEPLLEFVDDNKSSHFVEYLKSEPTRNIHHYHANLGIGLPVDLISIPFRDSNQRLIILSPLSNGASPANISQQQMASPPNIVEDQQADSGALWSVGAELLPDSSALSRLIAGLASNGRRAMRALWSTVAPEIITKQTFQNMQAVATSIANQQKGNSADNHQPALAVVVKTVGKPPKVRLSMPVLKSEADSSLTAALNHIGLVNTFDSAQANFIGINGHPFNYYKLHLSNVLYKTTLNINELGLNYDRTVDTLESARVASSHPTRVNHESTRRTQSGSSSQDDDQAELIDEVVLNGPFVYMICDVKTRLILYTGVVRNPARTSRGGTL